MQVKEWAQAARQASYILSALSLEKRNEALAGIKEALKKHFPEISKQNQADLAAAEGENLAGPLLKRLKFDEKKLKDVLDGLDSLIALPDPLGKTTLARELSPGLDLFRVSCPIGVIGVIFESRPDALVQIASLCLKSGNAALLKGGREALGTNRALMDAMLEGAKGILPDGWAALLETRSDVNDMLSQDGLIDLIIPRGSNAFVRYIMDHTRIPVMGHAEGLCHTYVDASADVDMAVRVTVDAKTQALAVCNATETLLVHRDIAPAFLPACAKALREKGVELRGDQLRRGLGNGIPGRHPVHQDRFLPGGSHRPHQPLWLPPHRRHHRPGPGGPAAVPFRRGQRGGIRELLHPLCRRLPLRLRGGSGYFHRQAPRPGPRGAGGPVYLQISIDRLRPNRGGHREREDPVYPQGFVKETM